MAVVWARLKRSRQWGTNDKGEQKGKRVYLVKCDDKEADDADVAAEACPAIGTTWDDDTPGLKVVDVSAEEVDDKPAGDITYYEVTLDYSTPEQDGGGGSEQSDEDPVNRPMIIRLSFDSMEETIYLHKDAAPTAEDADGNNVTVTPVFASRWKGVICNSSGIRMPLTEVIRDPCITITKNVDTNDFPRLWELLKQYVDTVNAADFKITYRGQNLKVKAKTCWLADITSEPKVETIKSTGVEKQFEEVNLVFRIREDGWLRKLLDQGKNAYLLDDFNPSKPAPYIRDENGDPVVEPCLLNGKGQKLPEGDKAVFLKFRTKELENFQSLMNFLS